jgi:plastocyanin
MKKLLLLLVAVVALAGATTATSDSTATSTVSISADGFKPDELVIRPGDTVTWRNADTKPHQIVSNTNAFPASPVLAAGKTYSFTFEAPSAYSYRDGRNSSMTGYVFVRGAGTTAHIAVSRLRLVYRNPVQVFGSVATDRPEPVTLSIIRYGGATETETLMTDADGIFMFEDRPRIRTAYEVSWRNGKSRQQPFVNVRPLVLFDVLNARANRYWVRVRAQRSYAGKMVSIQRRTRIGTWVTTKRVRLNSRGEARFRGSFVRGRTQARAWIGPAPGYVAGFSVTTTVRR